MKSILLASTASLAFAGAAFADGHESADGITFSGDFELGYNDDVDNGFYWSGGIDIAGQTTLDNGLVAAFSVGGDIVNGTDGVRDSIDVMLDGYEFSLTSDMGGIFVGDTDPAAEANWGGVDGSAADGFNDADVHLDSAADGGVDFDAILRGEVMYGPVFAALSYGVEIDGVNAATTEDLDAMQLYVSGEFGAVTVGLAYQDAFAGAGEILGIEASASLGGADVTVAYADNTVDTSIGAAVSYPVGPVTLGAYYTSNDVAADAYGFSADYENGPISVSFFYDDTDAANTDDYGLEGSYDVGNGLTVLAGIVDKGDAYYVAGEYDLGGGAELLVSFAEDDNNPGNDEIGDPEYKDGTTVQVSFEF